MQVMLYFMSNIKHPLKIGFILIGLLSFFEQFCKKSIFKALTVKSINLFRIVKKRILPHVTNIVFEKVSKLSKASSQREPQAYVVNGKSYCFLLLCFCFLKQILIALFMLSVFSMLMFLYHTEFDKFNNIQSKSKFLSSLILTNHLW
jgi:hypothetical protein